MVYGNNTVNGDYNIELVILTIIQSMIIIEIVLMMAMIKLVTTSLLGTIVMTLDITTMNIDTFNYNNKINNDNGLENKGWSVQNDYAIHKTLRKPVISDRNTHWRKPSAR